MTLKRMGAEANMENDLDDIHKSLDFMSDVLTKVIG